MNNSNLIERLDRFYNLNSEELAILITDVQAALSPVLPNEVREVVFRLRADGKRQTADLLERLQGDFNIAILQRDAARKRNEED